ncbi:uncharacterized protein LOC144112847 [Amblyomma americanum]
MEYYDPKIVTLRKNGTGFSVLPLTTECVSVGGAADCDIRIPGSGSHCCFFLVGKNEQALIINCFGTADLKLNGKDVHDYSVLSHGDIVQISYRKFRFDYGEKQKKENSSKVAAASHQPKAAGDATPTSNNKSKKASTEQAGAVACEEGDDEEEGVPLQDVTGSSLVMASTTQRKDVTFDKHLQREASPTKEVSVTRNTRAKRKVDLKEESIAEKHTTAEDLIGTVAEKSGGHQQRVASGEYAPQENDVQCSNSAKQVINPKITGDKEVVDDAPASPNVEVATVEPASAGGKALATTMEPKRSKRKMAAVKVDVAQTANEATPRKTRGRRAEALKTALEWADDKPGASRRTAKDRSEEEPPPKRTRKMV